MAAAIRSRGVARFTKTHMCLSPPPRRAQAARSACGSAPGTPWQGAAPPITRRHRPPQAGALSGTLRLVSPTNRYRSVHRDSALPRATSQKVWFRLGLPFVGPRAAGYACSLQPSLTVTATRPEQQNATATPSSTARPRELCRACAGEKSHAREADPFTETTPIPALAAHLGLRRRMARRSCASHPRRTRHHGAASTRRGARGARLRGPRPILLWLTNGVA